MGFIRNIAVIGAIFKVLDGYFGVGGFFRKDWIYFGLEFLPQDQGRMPPPDPPPAPAGSNVSRLSDHRKPQSTGDARPKPTALVALAARRRAR
ncbi:hypothetical protein [Inquilinus sp. OTU3971]|uniref:hypothetical protein n=1 Tax=Inquilinus sp. OTU3971 TaxID=3043855 RepID=UPI00313D7E78